MTYEERLNTPVSRKFICTTNVNRYTPASVWWDYITDEGILSSGDPIEDFGGYFIIDEEISSKQADRIFSALFFHEYKEENEKFIFVEERPDFWTRFYSTDHFVLNEDKIILAKILDLD